MEFSASMKVVYFGIGFTIAAALTMVGLSFVRPYIDENTPQLLRMLCMLAPLITGVPFGLRVVHVGRRDQLKLGSALKRALRP